MNFYRLVLLAGFIVLAGCTSTLPVGPYAYTEPKDAPIINRRAWVQDSAIKKEDLPLARGNVMKLKLDQNTVNFLDATDYFQKVDHVSMHDLSDTRPDDIFLSYEFENIYIKRRTNPAYFPLAFLTATVYIWANGTIFNEFTTIDGSVVARSKEGVELARASVKKEFKTKIGLYSKGYWMPNKSGGQALADFTDTAIANLATELNQGHSSLASD